MKIRIICKDCGYEATLEEWTHGPTAGRCDCMECWA